MASLSAFPVAGNEFLRPCPRTVVPRFKSHFSLSQEAEKGNMMLVQKTVCSKLVMSLFLQFTFHLYLFLFAIFSLAG